MEPLTLESVLWMSMAQVLAIFAHFWGDIALQNQWMAQHKNESSFVCAVHVLFYSMPFLVLMGAISEVSLKAWAVITVTHFIIDRFRLPQRWANFWGVGQKCFTLDFLAPGAPFKKPPAYLSVWLVIIIDQVFHLTINSLALLFLWRP